MTSELSPSAFITTGDLDEFDNIDEQVAMFACLLALFVVTLLSVFGALFCLVLGVMYLWGRFSLQHGPS